MKYAIGFAAGVLAMYLWGAQIHRFIDGPAMARGLPPPSR
jgi:hypothetical protein